MPQIKKKIRFPSSFLDDDQSSTGSHCHPALPLVLCLQTVQMGCDWMFFIAV
jgi:hypothetical protein